MFMTGGFVGLSGIGGPDPETERNPPSDPTPVSFPSYRTPDTASWNTSSAPDFRSLFAKILRPGDISDNHIQALNVHVLSTTSVDDMLPRMVDGTSYIPLLLAPSGASDFETEDRMRKSFDERLVELQVDNDTAFRVITRQAVKGVKPRLAHLRKFWEGLEVMSQYWDCSLDRYWEAAAPSDDEESRSAKRPRSTSNAVDGNEHLAKTITKDCTRPLSAADSTDLALTDSNTTAAVNSNASCACEDTPPPLPDSPEPFPSRRYKGRRTSTGRDMPELFRVTAIKAFVEGIIWPFRTSLANPRVMPIVQFGKLNVPVRQTAAVYQMPKERTKARQGWLTGPILGLQVRAEVEFVTENAKATTDRARLDLMRELGGLLQLAQERRRQGRTEVKPGEGEWWTTKRRWGGGPGGEVENEMANSDVVALSQDALDAVNDKKEGRGGIIAGERTQKAPAILGKELRCGKGYWDPKINYEAIGKQADSGYDEIFMVSALNHHISIVKLTIHDQYTDYLTSGVLPNPVPEDTEWSRPKLQRSQWFDLFDKEQRVEAFRGLWGVMAYMTR